MSYKNQNGSGTLAGDEYRTSMGLAATGALITGAGANCLSADHLNANELCVETIVRKQFDDTKRAKWYDGTSRGMGSALAAAVNLRQGIGVHKKQSDHSANTCADVIAAAT
jgi:hypothetical protein